MLRADDDAPAGRRGAGGGERGHEPGRRGVLDVAVQAGRQPEQVGEPGERHLLELLERRRRAPEDPDLVEAGREELGEDPRLEPPSTGSTRSSAGSASGSARQQHLVEVAQHGGERLARLGRPVGQRGADRARLDAREHRAARARRSRYDATHSSAAAPSSRNVLTDARLRDLAPGARVEDLLLRQPRPPRLRDAELRVAESAPVECASVVIGTSTPASPASRAWTSRMSSRSGWLLISSAVPVSTARATTRSTSTSAPPPAG